MEKIMNSTTQTKTDFATFRNLDTVSGLREISDQSAAICSGGREIFNQPVDFDFNLPLNSGQPFYLGADEGLSLIASTSSKSGNDKFTAVLKDSSGNQVGERKQFNVGLDRKQWINKNIKGGNYTLTLLDEQDGIEVNGSVTASTVSNTMPV
jgi:hypothetical protein